MDSEGTIAIIEDDVAIRDLVADVLRANGFMVEGYGDSAAFFRQADVPSLDCLILDLMLPGEDGLSICQTLRVKVPQLPILMVTAKGDDIDRIIGLECGADDYLPKPFDPRELLVRIKVVLRRVQSFPDRARLDEAPSIRFAGWQLDTRARQLLSPEGVVVSLGNSDYRVLRLLLQHPNRPLSRDFLLNHVFDKDSTPFDRSIDVCVSRLRSQLPANVIKTVRNEGYMLTADDVVLES